jgi:hypothetical protein
LGKISNNVVGEACPTCIFGAIFPKIIFYSLSKYLRNCPSEKCSQKSLNEKGEKMVSQNFGFSNLPFWRGQ